MSEATITLVELQPRSERIVITLSTKVVHSVHWSSRPPFTALPTPTELFAGDYRCRIRRGGRIEVVDAIIIELRPFQSAPADLQRAFEREGDGVPCRVRWETAAPAAPAVPPATSPGSTSRGPAPFPVRANVQALREDQRLRGFTWELLNHFAKAPAKRSELVTYEDIEAEMTRNPQARVVVERVTQAWEEYRLAGAADWSTFERLTETIVEQQSFGNETFALNRLALRRGPEGWGLYHRANDIRFYDALGAPVESFMGMLWDKHYKWSKGSAPSPLAIEVSPDDPIFAIIEAYRAGGVPSPNQIEAAAAGYFDNADLLWEELQKDRNSLQRFAQVLGDQLPILAGFIALEAIQTALRAQPVVWMRLVGEALRRLIQMSMYALNIHFVSDTTQVLLRIGAALYRVRRGPDGKPDRLSQRHLAEAAKDARELIDAVTTLVLMLAVMRSWGEWRNRPPAEPRPPAPSTFTNPPFQPALASGPVAVPVRTSAMAAAAAGGPHPLPPGLIVASTSTREAIEKLEERDASERREARERETQKAEGEAAEQGEKEWRKFEREMQEEINSQPKSSGTVRITGKRVDTTIERIVTEMEASAQTPAEKLAAQQARERASKLFSDEGTRTVARLLEEMGLKGTFDKYRALAERRLQHWREQLKQTKQTRDALMDPTDPNYARAFEEVKYWKQLLKQLDDFGNGLLKMRFFDAIEVFLNSKRMSITDATFRIGEIFHMMKSMTYREMMRKVFPDFDVSVWEYSQGKNIRKLEATPDFARDLEKAVDTEMAKEQ